MDRFLTFVALEVMTCHWDGYSLNRNNYRVFPDRSTGKMVFMPHGLDQTFGIGRSSPTASIKPGMSGMVARAVISTPMGGKRYLERIASLRAGVSRSRNSRTGCGNSRGGWSRLWRPTRRTLRRCTGRACARFCGADHRASPRSITEQLASPQDSFSFDDSGVARLTGWRTSVSGGGPGSARFERERWMGLKSLADPDERFWRGGIVAVAGNVGVGAVSI